MFPIWVLHLLLCLAFFSNSTLLTATRPTTFLSLYNIVKLPKRFLTLLDDLRQLHSWLQPRPIHTNMICICNTFCHSSCSHQDKIYPWYLQKSRNRSLWKGSNITNVWNLSLSKGSNTTNARNHSLIIKRLKFNKCQKS